MTIENFSDYKKYTRKRFKSQGPDHPALLRAALELMEEYLEYCIEPSEDELGDICFWFGYLSCLADYDRHYGEFDGAFRHDAEIFKDIAGSVKRYYRDGNYERLTLVKEALLPELEIWLEEECNCNGFDLDGLMVKNYNKLEKRFNGN